MTRLIAVDGGKSRLRVRVVGAAGVRDGAGPGFRHGPDDVAELHEAIVETVARTVDGPVAAEATATVAGLTGAPGDPERRARLSRLLARSLGGRVRILDDAAIAHAGALAGPGVVLSVGTGVAALGLDGRGRHRQRDGWGPRLGDRGSAFRIGEAGLRAAFAALDGIGATTLAARLPEVFGTRTPGLPEVQDFHRDLDAVARTAAFAVAVLDEADRDETARAIVDGALDDLCGTAAAVADALGLTGGERRVALTGRLLRERATALAGLGERLAARSLDLVPPAGDALDGALALAAGALSLYDDVTTDGGSRT